MFKRLNTPPSIADGLDNNKVYLYLKGLKMSKKPSNSGKEWTNSQLSQLKKLAKENTPTRVIGLKLHRTPASIYNEASKEGIHLKPTNQAPYNRKKR